MKMSCGLLRPVAITLTKEAASTSEKSANFYQVTRRKTQKAAIFTS
jgi:hypothetical protein